MTGLDLGLGTSRSRLFLRSRDQDQDLSHLVSRPRPRPQPPDLETKTKILATRSRDRDQDLSLQVTSELEFKTLGLEITSLLQSNNRCLMFSLTLHKLQRPFSCFFVSSLTNMLCSNVNRNLKMFRYL